MSFKDNKRIAIVDLWRFVWIVVIICHHIPLTGIGVSKLPFADMGWICADFFFVLTGYLTYKHFEETSSKGDFDQTVRYLVRKYKHIFPYSVISVISCYVIEAFQLKGYGLKTVIGSFFDLPVELFYLKLEGKSIVVWFLTSMLIVFPIFLLILQIRSNSVICLISFSLSAAYYVLDNNESINTVYTLFRAMAGLLLGAFIGSILPLVIIPYLKDKNRKMLTAAEVLFMMAPIIITALNIKVPRVLLMLLLFFGLSIMLSGFSCTAQIESGILTRLGAISLPIFLLHPIIIRLFGYLSDVKALRIVPAAAVVLYFFFTFVLSAVVYRIVNGKRNR